MADTGRLAITPVQKVVVVDGNAEVLGMLEAVLDAGRYDMVFVESSDHAYTQIKKVVPNLVIVCARIEQLESFQLLTMLKLDSDTRDIPVLTYTTEYEGQDIDTATSRLAEDDEHFLPSRRPIALRMNSRHPPAGGCYIPSGGGPQARRARANPRGTARRGNGLSTSSGE